MWDRPIRGVPRSVALAARHSAPGNNRIWHPSSVAGEYGRWCGGSGRPGPEDHSRCVLGREHTWL